MADLWKSVSLFQFDLVALIFCGACALSVFSSIVSVFIMRDHTDRFDSPSIIHRKPGVWGENAGFDPSQGQDGHVPGSCD